MSVSLSPWNIKVCIVEPGSVRTKEVSTNFEGTRALETPHPYESFLRVEDSEEGENPQDLAKFLHTIMQSPSSHVRYQFAPFANELAKKVYTDPTGDAVRQFNIDYHKQMGRLP